MNTLLVTIAVLGLSALIVSAYIFAAAARTFVSHHDDEGLSGEPLPNLHRRSEEDRRRAPAPARFPILAGGQWIMEDRRRTPDRRKQSSWKMAESGS